MYEARQQKNMINRSITTRKGIKLFKFNDNRSKYRKTISIQLKAKINTPTNEHPLDIHKMRTLFYDVSYDENGVKKVHVYANPHFGVNCGGIKSLSDNNRIYGTNIGGGAHTEPVLLSKLYGGENHWKAVNETLNAKKNRKHFIMITERYPCPSCQRNLNNDIFTGEDIVCSCINLSTNSFENAKNISNFYKNEAMDLVQLECDANKEYIDGLKYNGRGFIANIRKKNFKNKK